jgi:hypothetical protein
MNSPYSQSSGNVRLIPSFVCYADILGYKTLSIKAIRNGNSIQFLSKLRSALSSAYKRIRLNSQGFSDKDSVYSVKIFTDNIVVGYPLFRPMIDFGEAELCDIFSIFSEFQTGLAMEGFFLRGGIAFGEHYMDDDIVFGKAFLEAHKQDKEGGPPRITLAPSAIEVVRKQLDKYGDASWTPQYNYLLEDTDGSIFLNYLDEAFKIFPEGGILFDLVESHQKAIKEGLIINKGNAGIRAKYEWAARYHNFLCNEYIEIYPISSNPDLDEEYGVACTEAQKLRNYLINIDSLAATPSRLKLTPIKNK